MCNVRFEIFQTILTNQSTLTPIFSRAVPFHFTSDVIDLTGVFYPTIFQYILNDYFVLNKGNWKRDILGLGKVWQYLYVYGIVLFSYLTYVHFGIILTVRYIIDFVNITW